VPSSNSDAQLRAVVAIARIAIEGDTDEPAERVPSLNAPHAHIGTFTPATEELVEEGERGAQRGAYHSPRLLISPHTGRRVMCGRRLRGACWGYPVRATTQAPRGISYPAVGVRV